MKSSINRRQFIHKGLCTGIGLGLLSGRLYSAGMKPSQWSLTSHKPLAEVRIGFIGCGGMGTVHIRNLLKIEGARIKAVCDIVPARVERTQQLCVEAGFDKPQGYSNGEYDFKNLCTRSDLDLVYIATPWRWHVPMCVEAMTQGKHAATEVPAAVTIEECWKLVETAESTNRYCIMMENCNYDRIELMILNVAQKGLLGQLQHAECGYLHDLRSIKFSNQGEGLWRPEHSQKRNGDLYPTHGLGPVAQCMDINRGNCFKSLVSMSCVPKGLQEYAVDHFGPESDQAHLDWKLGDIVTTLIQTNAGQTIVLKHDTNLPRPYSRGILLQGTKGIVRKYPTPKIHIEGKSPAHTWEDLANYDSDYEHPVWTQLHKKGEGVGHGGMDFIEDYRLINAFLKGIEPDMDVYDAATLSCVSELSEQSIARGNTPIEFPDFTKGRWKAKRQLPVMA